MRPKGTTQRLPFASPTKRSSSREQPRFARRRSRERSRSQFETRPKGELYRRVRPSQTLPPELRREETPTSRCRGARFRKTGNLYRSLPEIEEIYRCHVLCR